MSGHTLECPDAAEHLYLAASQDEVPTARPFMTGDVFTSIAVPGLDSTGLAIVLTHPCSMRADGVRLAPRLLMARVAPTSPIPLPDWRNGHFKVMPLPELLQTRCLCLDADSVAARARLGGVVDRSQLRVGAVKRP